MTWLFTMDVKHQIKQTKSLHKQKKPSCFIKQLNMLITYFQTSIPGPPERDSSAAARGGSLVPATEIIAGSGGEEAEDDSG